MPREGTLVMSVGLSAAYLHVEHEEDCPDLGPSCASDHPPPPERHITDVWAYDLRLDAELGILRWLSAEVTFYLRSLTEETTYTDLRGASIIPPDAGIHHRNHTLIGPGDPWVMARVGGSRGRLAGSIRLGFTVPLGSTVPDPFALGARGIAHEHFQLGDGTVDPIAELDGRWYMGRANLGAWALMRLPVYENGYGYRAGGRYVAGAFAESRLGLHDFTFSVGLDLSREEAETWHGQVYTEGNLGRTDLLLDTMVVWRFAHDWAAALAVRGYLYSAVTGEQAASPFTGDLSVIRAFDVWGGD